MHLCLQVAAEGLEHTQVTTNYFHLGASFLHTSLDALQRTVPAPGTRPWKCLTKGQFQKSSLLCPWGSSYSHFHHIITLAPLLFFFFFSLSPFQLRLKETKLDRKITALLDQLTQLRWAEQALRCTAASPGAGEMLWHFSLLPVPSAQHSVSLHSPHPCLTPSSFLPSHSGSPLLSPHLLPPLSACCV